MKTCLNFLRASPSREWQWRKPRRSLANKIDMIVFAAAQLIVGINDVMLALSTKSYLARDAPSVCGAIRPHGHNLDQASW